MENKSWFNKTIEEVEEELNTTSDKGLSIRDVIGVGINMVIEKYEKSHGAIHVKKKQKGNIDEIFQ